MVSAADRAKDPARTSVWLNHRPPSRARKSDQPAGLDRDRITAASVRLLDAEGLAKFSMRRLAAELNVTAMSLYWYVDTKDDLLELALDSVYSEIDPRGRTRPGRSGCARWRPRTGSCWSGTSGSRRWPGSSSTWDRTRCSCRTPSRT